MALMDTEITIVIQEHLRYSRIIHKYELYQFRHSAVPENQRLVLRLCNCIIKWNKTKI